MHSSNYPQPNKIMKKYLCLSCFESSETASDLSKSSAADSPQYTSPKQQEMHPRPVYPEESGFLFTSRSESTEDAPVEVRAGVFRCRYQDGSVYEGGWRNGARHGLGQMSWSTGKVYEGNWSDGKPEGTGTMQLAGGKRFTGNWEQFDYMGSEDVLQCQLASVEKWLEAMNDGYIWLWYIARCKLVEVEADPYSRSILSFNDSQIFAIHYMISVLESSFSRVETRPHSMKQQYPGMRTYIGCHNLEKPDGVGKYVFGPQCWYEGEFSNGVMQGLGIHHWPGKVVRGWWRQGVLDGYGDIEDKQGYRKVQWSQGHLCWEARV